MSTTIYFLNSDTEIVNILLNLQQSLTEVKGLNNLNELNNISKTGFPTFFIIRPQKSFIDTKNAIDYVSSYHTLIKIIYACNNTCDDVFLFKNLCDFIPFNVDFNTNLNRYLIEKTYEHLNSDNLYNSAINYKNIFSAFFDGIIITDKNGKIKVWDNRMEQLTGISSQLIIDKYFTEVLKKLSSNNSFCNALYSSITPYINSDSKTFLHLLPSEISLFNTTKSPFDNFVLTLQIRTTNAPDFFTIFTAKKIIENNKVASYPDTENQYMENLFNSIHLIMCKINTSGQPVFFNKAWLQLRQTTLSEELTNNWTKQIHNSDFDNYNICFNNVKTKKTAQNVQVRLLCHQHIKTIKFAIIPYYTINKQFDGILLVGYDISEYINLVTDLEHARNEAEESDRLKSCFLTNISHEIRTPMNSILGFSELMYKNDLSTDKLKLFLGMIRNSTYHLLNLITSIIEYSKLEAGDMRIDNKELNINLLIDDLYEYYETDKININKEKIELLCVKSFSYSESIVSTDHAKLRKIFCNLIENALKFTHEGFVKFGYLPGGSNSILFFVEDTGIGIEKEKQAIIFDRFRQEDETHERLYGGTGIGLAITKRMIELLNGKIWVESVKNKGTIMYFTLPFEGNNYSGYGKTALVQPRINIYNLHGKSILVVEDVQPNLLLITEYLTSVGIIVHPSKSGEEAINIYKTNKNIDLILMDIYLPAMNGISASEKLREINNNVKIIAQTAYASEFNEQSLLNNKLKFNMILHKPFGRNELLEAIWLTLFT